MSDFLNQFNKDNYRATPEDAKKTAPPQPQSQGFAAPPNAEPVGRFPVEKEKKATPAKIEGPEHITEVDTSYHKRKIIRYSIIGGSVLVGCLLIFFLFRIMNQVEIKNFVGTSISDAKTWGLTNQVSIETESVYNNEYDENIIIDQNKEANSKIQKGSVLQLTVSLGPDPDEKIELPDFESMMLAEVYNWKQEHRATNVSINEEFSDTVEKGKFIRMQFSNNAIDESNYTRKENLTIYMSKGAEVLEKNVEVPDFAEKTKQEVQEWAKTNEIEVTYAERTSDTIEVGAVIEQDIEAKTKIAKKSKMTVVISIGRAVVVPNFNSISMEDAPQYSEALAVNVKTMYSGSVSYGRVISQSQPAGTELVGEGAKVDVVYSLGRPYIDNIIGQSEKELQTYFYDFTSKGANISYTIYYVDSAAEKGSVVDASRYGEFVEMNAHIDVYVSRGNLSE